MNERVIKIIEYYKMSVSSFAEKIGSNQVTVNQQVNGDRKISLDTITKILNAYPELSSEWLLTGKGEMIKPSSESSRDNNVSSRHIISSNIGDGNNRNVISISLPEQGSKKIIEPDGTIRIESESQKTALTDSIEKMHQGRIADLEKLVKTYSALTDSIEKMHQGRIADLEKLVKTYSDMIDLLKK